VFFFFVPLPFSLPVHILLTTYPLLFGIVQRVKSKMTERDPVVVIGYGRIGLVHLDSVLRHRQLTLLALVGTNAQRCQQALQKAIRPYLTSEGKLKDGTLPQAWTVEQLKQALQNPNHKIKYAIIASPTPEHGALVSLFLNANPPVHILVEKPLTTDPKYNQMLYETAALKKVVLLTGTHKLSSLTHLTHSLTFSSTLTLTLTLTHTLSLF
jgi:predicted dehydrogenase